MGDSVFDNSAYVPLGYDVGYQLTRLLSDDWVIENLAEDGATTSTVLDQISRASSSEHVLLSVGGNDALLHADLLLMHATSISEALGRVADATAEFESAYGPLLRKCAQAGRKLTVCTVYEGSHEKSVARAINGAIRMFNDAVFRCAVTVGADVLDLRSVCSEPTDFVNSIEPSAAGGAKIAKSISHVLAGQHRFSVFT